MTKAFGQRNRFVPGQEFALLDIHLGFWKLGDRAHVIEVRMRDEDVADIVAAQPHFCEHSQRRNPRRDAELSREPGFMILKAAVGAEFSFRLRAASIPGCVSLVSDAEERAGDGL